MVVLRTRADTEVDYDLGEKRFAPGFREVVRNVERQPVASRTQRRILMEIAHPSICISRPRSDKVVGAFERDADPLCGPTECRVQHVRAERAHAIPLSG